MIGLDTNVLLRLFVVDDEAEVQRARRFVGAAVRDDTVLVNGIVLSADDLQIVHRSAAERALASYSRGKADFADYFLAEINAELGCGATFTFDVDALNSPNFSPVP